MGPVTLAPHPNVLFLSVSLAAAYMKPPTDYLMDAANGLGEFVVGCVKDWKRFPLTISPT